MKRHLDLDAALDIIRDHCRARYPHLESARVIVELERGGQVCEQIRMPIAPTFARAVEVEPFSTNSFQRGILAALDGKALRTDKLGDAVGDRRRLYRNPGGLKELEEQGLVKKHERLGYYRPDSPPPELENEA